MHEAHATSGLALVQEALRDDCPLGLPNSCSPELLRWAGRDLAARVGPRAASHGTTRQVSGAAHLYSRPLTTDASRTVPTHGSALAHCSPSASASARSSRHVSGASSTTLRERAIAVSAR